MNSIVKVGTVFAALGLCMACVSTEDVTTTEPRTALDPATPDDGASTDRLAPQVGLLHEFDAEGVHFRFLDSEGDLLIAFTRPRLTPLPAVRGEEHEQLTMLELYLALQPQGVPDPRLLDDHIAQSAYLGRPNASVHTAFIEPPSVEKNLQDDCIGIAAGFTGGTFVSPFYTKGDLLTFQNDACTSARTSNGELGYMMHEACNIGPSAVNETVEFAKKTGSAGSFILQYSTVLGPGNSSGIIQNTGNRTTRFDLRAKVTSAVPSFNARLACGTFGEAR
jgi:hypothetical protein